MLIHDYFNLNPSSYCKPGAARHGRADQDCSVHHGEHRPEMFLAHQLFGDASGSGGLGPNTGTSGTWGWMIINYLMSFDGVSRSGANTSACFCWCFLRRRLSKCLRTDAGVVPHDRLYQQLVSEEGNPQGRTAAVTALMSYDELFKIIQWIISPGNIPFIEYIYILYTHIWTVYIYI